MGVEIIILSGSRQGEQLVLNTDEFRVGGDSSCDVFFDPDLDATASQRVALLQKTDEGWYIRNVGRGELLLNQEVVSGRTRIRSGDIVRLSDHGPDFGFEITAGRPRPLCAAERPETSAFVGDEGFSQSGDAESTLAPRPTSRGSQGRLIFFTATTVVAIFLLSLLATLALFGIVTSDVQHNAAALTQPNVKTHEVISPTRAKPAEQTKDKVDDGEAAKADARKAAGGGPQQHTVAVHSESSAGVYPKKQAADTPPLAVSPAPDTRHKDAAAVIAHDCEKMLWLVELCDTEGKFVYPFATAVAVGEHTLLTTASVAQELEKFRSRGWKITAVNAMLKKTVDIENIRLHGVYADLAGRREQQIYVDLAVLQSVQNLGKTIALPASAAELARLDTGTELACVGISHLGDAVKPEDALQPQLLSPKAFLGKVFLRTKLDPRSASSPRMLHFKAQLGENMYGSPIINKNGHVVAVYAETAAGGEAKRLGLHYAPVLDPALIRTAVEGKAEPYWVRPPAMRNDNRKTSN